MRYGGSRRSPTRATRVCRALEVERIVGFRLFPAYRVIVTGTAQERVIGARQARSGTCRARLSCRSSTKRTQGFITAFELVRPPGGSMTFPRPTRVLFFVPTACPVRQIIGPNRAGTICCQKARLHGGTKAVRNPKLYPRRSRLAQPRRADFSAPAELAG